MSKKFKSQASSARAASNAFGAPSFGFASTSSTSSLSYISEQPDLSTISNPSLVVSLRNLGKKDSTTKAKALDEIQEHVRIAGAEIEDAVINAWVELYPRTSVDNARRVRQLAHTIQGAVTTAAGKRIAPRLAKVIGTWLSGQYDNDRSVARAATDALAVSFATADKRQALWKLYKDSLLDYAEDAILVQTVQTLSDERSTSKDDAESKHARVSGSAMAMLGHLIKANAGSSSFHTKVGHIIQNKVLWEFVSNGDPYLRRSVCTLATLCASEFKDVLDWQVISSRFLYKGLVADQLGSSAQYSASLVTLTTIEPAIWTTFYSGKTSPVKKLCQFFKKGSSRGNEDVWRNHASLLRQIPQAALTKNSDDFALEDAATIAGALYDGVTNSDEPRYNLYAAWSCYIDLTFWLQSLLRTREARSVFFSDHIAGLLTAYVHEPRQVTGFPSSSAQRLVAKIISHLREDDSHAFFADLWSRMVSALVEQMRVSLPESSHDFRTSQDAVAASSTRLFKTRSACTENTSVLDSQAVSEAFRSGDELLFTAAVDLLSKRNGKPYGAASVLSDLVSLQNFNKSDTELNAFLEGNIDQLLHSPSADKAVSLWRSCGHAAGLLLRSLLANQPLDERSEKAVTTILASALPDDIDAHSDVVNALCSTGSVSVTTALLSNANLHPTQPALYYFEKLLSETSPNASREQQLHAVSALNDIFANAEAKSAISSTSRAGEIVARLLYLADSPDSKLADAASAALAKLRASPNVTVQGSSTSMTVILDQLSGAQPQISILALVDLALSEYQNAADKLQSAVGLLPTPEQWEAALHSHFVHKRPASLAVSNPLQAVVYTLEASPSRATVLPHDGEDFSMAFRFAIYVSKLCAVPSFMESLSVQSPDALHQYFPLTLQLVSEKLSLEEANELWVNSTPEVLDEAADVLSEGNAAIQQWIANEDSSFVGDWLGRGKELQGNTVEAYLRARAFADIASRSSQQDGGSSIATQFDAQVRQLHRSSELIQSAAIAYSAREYLISSSAGRKVLNELISDATQLKIDTLATTTMKSLVLLNIMLDGDSEALEGIPSQRLVFLMQNLVRLLSAATLDMLVESEIFKLLAVVLPAVQDIYGDHWQDILGTLISTWTELNDSDDDLPMLHSTLRLYQKLKISAGKEDVNEDLQEAWQEKTNDLDNALLKCLHLFGKPDQGINQPRQICAELLGRLLRGVKIGDLEPIYPLLSTPSDAVLETAFSILHEVIPERQEQLSVDLILEKQTMHLPAELMELILDDQDTAIARKRYLICWKLIFRHFEKASYKLREMYVTDLKGKSELSRLLDLCCQTFRITDSRPVDVSKVDDFQTFTPESFQGFGDERGIQHLSINLYYSSLLYTPGLVKTWFIEQKNRIKSPLEAWTQKHITPTIVAASFDTVSEWSQTQDKEDSPVEIKANSRSAELVASMPIDPESPPIAISVILPSAYPLNSPTVVGKTRVAVSDKNWQSWLRTIQIIIFSTGSIIEGLVAFRRNVQGALKGQDLTTFLKSHHLSHKLDIFHRAALLIQGDLPPSQIDGITPQELLALDNEIYRKWRQPTMMYLAITCTALGAMGQGWAQTAMNGANLYFPKAFGIDADTPQNNLILGLINSGIYLSNGLLGAWLVAPLNKRCGRRGAVFCATLVSLLTNLGGAVTMNWQQLLVMRLVLGCGLGVVSSTLNVYAAECAPAVIRGGLAVSWQLFTAFGIFVGFVANVMVYDYGPDTWRLQLAGPALTTLPLLGLIYVCPETPAWKIKNGGKWDHAHHSLTRLRNTELQAAKELYLSYLQGSTKHEHHESSYLDDLRDLFTIPRIRRATLAAYTVMICQQLCGINIISFYSSTIFADAHFSTFGALMASTVFGLINFLFALPAVWTMDTLGRRSLLLLTLPFMSLTMFGAALAFSIPEDSSARPVVLASMIYLFCAEYSPGMGPVPSAYAAEVFPLSHREIGMSSAVAVTNLWASALSSTFPRILSGLGSQGAFALYAVLNVVAVLLVFLFVPETRLKTLEELDGVFSVSTRKFIRYQATEYLPWWTKRYVLREKGLEPPALGAEATEYRELDQDEEETL